MSEELFQVTGETIVDELDNMYLNFVVGDEIYGIEIRYVIQIVGMQEINEMPEMQPGMKGFINLRGSVIPVFSMRYRFGKMENDYTDRTCIIVVMINDKEIGLIVDAIQETITIDADSISPPPGLNEVYDGHPVKGIAHLPNERTGVLLHAPNLFNVDSL